MNYPQFTICPPATVVNKVSAIKALRSLSGLGLKEAKDAIEAAHLQQTFNNIIASVPLMEQEMATLRANGIEVRAAGMFIIEELRRLAADALKAGEDELANEILQLVLAEKLRRSGS